MATYVFLRLDLPSGTSVGPSRIAILEGIGRYGSISASARAVGLTYRQVWSTIQVLNESFPEPVVTVRKAGPSGGASLTPLGQEIVRQFRAIEERTNKTLKRQLTALERLTKQDPAAPKCMPRWVQLIDADAATPKADRKVKNLKQAKTSR